MIRVEVELEPPVGRGQINYIIDNVEFVQVFFDHCSRLTLKQISKLLIR